MSEAFDEILRDGSLTGSESLFICGPCAVETKAQVFETAAFLREQGVRILRGGAYKPRTSPDSFQGVGQVGLEWLAEAARQSGMLTVSEVMDACDLPLFRDTVDILQIGSRNMQNFSLLRKVGRAGKPVLLKRGFMSTAEEFLFAAEYVRREANSLVILCERGIRTFEPWTRNTLDLSTVALIRRLTNYPVIVDLSHALGRTDIMRPLANASLACGASGIMLEVHPNPPEALCDGHESLSFEEFGNLMDGVRPFLQLLGANGHPARASLSVV